MGSSHPGWEGPCALRPRRRRDEAVPIWRSLVEAPRCSWRRTPDTRAQRNCEQRLAGLVGFKNVAVKRLDPSDEVGGLDRGITLTAALRMGPCS
jgi:hypothetical protein